MFMCQIKVYKTGLIKSNSEHGNGTDTLFHRTYC